MRRQEEGWRIRDTAAGKRYLSGHGVPTGEGRPAAPADRARGGQVLVMGNVSDAETPLENGEELHSMIPASQLIVLDTMGHTGFYRSQCLATAGGATLTRGELPADGTRCAA